MKLNKIFKKLCELGWQEADRPFTITSKNKYILEEDTGSWLMLFDHNRNRIWDYPVLSSHVDWLCSTIERDCTNHSLKMNGYQTKSRSTKEQDSDE